MSIRQWRTVIPGRQEANRVSPLTFQVHCLQRISRPWCREDKYRQGPVNSLSCGDRDESLARVHRTDRVSERVTRREVHRVYRGSPSHIQQRTGQPCGLPVRKLHQARERTLAEGIQKNSACHSNMTRNSACSTSQTGKLHDSQGTGQSTQKGLAYIMGNNQSQIVHCLTNLNRRA